MGGIEALPGSSSIPRVFISFLNAFLSLSRSPLCFTHLRWFYAIKI